MKRGQFFLLFAFLLLSGCASADPGVYWTEYGADFRVELRDSASNPSEREVVFFSGGESTVLRTLAETDSARITAETFPDILGWSGFRLTEQQGRQEASQSWNVRTYYAVEDHKAREIAVSFGWGEPRDYMVDLDGDGQRELVSNVVYGGDGHEGVIIYQRRDNQVWRGRHSAEGLPDYENRGVNSTAVNYDPVQNLFLIRYTRKGQEEPGIIEVGGLERVEFSPPETQTSPYPRNALLELGLL